MSTHFGETVRKGKYGFHLSRDTYAIINKKSSFEIILPGRRAIGGYEDEEKKVYTDEWCEQHRLKCLQNFDLNMSFFKNLSQEEFIRCVDDFLKKFPFFESVDDLKRYDGKPGYYLMVLDGYKQVYIGTTKDIRKRIKQHWGSSTPFDRLMLGDVSASKLSINSFRSLDTTRLYAFETFEIYDAEDKFLDFFPRKFVLNRVPGGNICSEGGHMSLEGYLEVREYMSSHSIAGDRL